MFDREYDDIYEHSPLLGPKTSPALPTATLDVETAAISPPKPLGYAVMVAGRPIAVITEEAAAEAYAKFQALNMARVAKIRDA